MPFMGTDAPNLELDSVAERLPGATLKNGSVVVAAGVRRSYFIVLTVRADTALHQSRYVTWALSPRDGECFWGHYFDSLDEALGDFQSRCGS